MADPIGTLSVPHLGDVPATAPMSNLQYEQQVSRKLEAIRTAATDLTWRKHPQFDVPGIATPWGTMDSPMPNAKPFKVPIEGWRPLFLEFLWPNLEASIGLDSHFTAPGHGPLDRLHQLGADGNPAKGSVIRSQLNEWYSPDTESAARLFKDRYCEDINEMVMAQIQMMQSFQLILRSQTALIELGRHQALRIADATIHKLGKAAEAENEQTKKLIRDFAGAAVTLSSGGGGPAIVSGVASVLKTLGVDPVLDAALEGQGDEAWDITDWMTGKLADLRRQIRERSETLQDAIRRLDWYLTGRGTGPGQNSIEKLLPEDVEI